MAPKAYTQTLEALAALHACGDPDIAAFDALLQRLGVPAPADDLRKRPLDLVATCNAIPQRWACPGIYVLRVVDPECPFVGAEYIGKSINVRTRLMQHLFGLDPDECWEGAARGVCGEVLKRHFEARVLSLFPQGISPRDLANTEQYWIDLLRPFFNRRPAKPRSPGREAYSIKTRSNRRAWS